VARLRDGLPMPSLSNLGLFAIRELDGQEEFIQLTQLLIEFDEILTRKTKLVFALGFKAVWPKSQLNVTERFQRQPRLEPATLTSDSVPSQLLRAILPPL
jgi:hypothetical protein